jgi:hypothetical protein
MAIRITRINPRTGQVERPWRNRDHVFVLGDPAHGARKHHDKFAVKVATIEEVAAYIGRGFSVRMTDGESPPSLIAPDSLTVERVDDSDATSMWADTAAKPPFAKDDMMVELRRAMLVQANQIAHTGNLSFALAFIGFETINPIYPYCEDDPRQVDLDRFAATAYLDQAYDFAFQVGQYWEFGDGTAQNVAEFIRGANPQASNGDQSPLADPEGLCRRAADTAFGRWKLKKGFELTVRELALLGQMKETAVRNSLSKERIAIDNGAVANEVAVSWLQQRRDFIPSKTEQGRKERWAAYSKAMLTHRDFPKAFAKIMDGFPMTAAELATKASVKPGFVAALAEGRPSPDLEALRRVGAALDLDEPHFVGAAIQASLRS